MGVPQPVDLSRASLPAAIVASVLCAALGVGWAAHGMVARLDLSISELRAEVRTAIDQHEETTTRVAQLEATQTVLVQRLTRLELAQFGLQLPPL